MRIAKIEYLIRSGSFSASPEWDEILEEIEQAIQAVVWPQGNTSFVLNPSKGKGRGEGNGVRPIKDACMKTLKVLGWNTSERRNPLRLDATRLLKNGKMFGLEWETGNISSSHRAVNRILLGHMQDILVGGVLIVPTRELYQYLTDRVGNIQELEPYFVVWQSYPLQHGMLLIIAVEHDGIQEGVPRILKGTDGRALI